MSRSTPRIAVLVPCLNEETTVSKVVTDLRRELPEAQIYVFDNRSSDATAARAAEAGALVIEEPERGKGNVVRAMFRKIDADAYLMLDGDDTYPAEAARALLAPILAGEAEMVVGDRLSSTYHDENTRPLHGFGNELVRTTINILFGARFTDIMSGYRAFSRLFVKTMPVMSGGFEVETEMTVHALDKRLQLREIPIDYRDRPAGSASKLSTFRDGFRVLRTIGRIFRDFHPLAFFATCAAVCGAAGLAIGAGPIMEFMEVRYVYRVPSAILAASLELLAMLLLACGLILETNVRHYREQFERFLNEFAARERMDYSNE